jgi:hypothetical protein
MKTAQIAASATAIFAFLASFACLAFPPAEFTVIPAAPRYMEPVYLRMNQTAGITEEVIGAAVTMNGNNLDVRVTLFPEPGIHGDDVMLGRLPAGTYTVTVDGSPVVATFTVAPEPQGPSGRVPPVNYTDLWWNPAESGWGMTINQGPTNQVFAVWFVYDAAGNPVWYTLQPGQWDTMKSYTGVIYRTTGSPFNAVFDPASIVEQRVGTGSLAFSSATTGVFAYTIDGVNRTKSIQRMTIE